MDTFSAKPPSPPSHVVCVCVCGCTVWNSPAEWRRIDRIIYTLGANVLMAKVHTDGGRRTKNCRYEQIHYSIYTVNVLARANKRRSPPHVINTHARRCGYAITMIFSSAHLLGIGHVGHNGATMMMMMECSAEQITDLSCGGGLGFIGANRPHTYN